MIYSYTKIKEYFFKETLIMAITKKQQELDVAKWIKSEEIGADACGTFDYCAKCDKSLENPCDKAYKAFNKKPVAKKAEPAKKVELKPVAKVEVKVEAKPAVKEVAAAKVAKPATKAKKK